MHVQSSIWGLQNEEQEPRLLRQNRGWHRTVVCHELCFNGTANKLAVGRITASNQVPGTIRSCPTLAPLSYSPFHSSPTADFRGRSCHATGHQISGGIRRQAGDWGAASLGGEFRHGMGASSGQSELGAEGRQRGSE